MPLPTNGGLVSSETADRPCPRLSSSTPRTLFGRGADERGAVMVTGVFMASFLVGALWYLMGIGDAIVFRDRMQEGTDHAAFTSAALHAKGMNFIAACNIVMLALVAVHIILGIVHDFALAACILSLGTGCEGWVNAREIYDGYSKVMKPTLTVIHYLEVGAGYGYPWLGAIKGFEVGSGYGKKGKVDAVTIVPVSTSMIPGDLYGAAKLGLPIKARKLDFLCEKLGNVVFDWTRQHVPLPGLGLVGSAVNAVLGGETAESLVKKIIGGALTLRYCNGLGGAGASAATGRLDEQLKRGETKIDENNADANDANTKNRAKPGDPGYQKPTKKPAIDRTKPDPDAKKGFGGWQPTIDPGFDKGWGNEGPYVVQTGAYNGNDQLFVWAINIQPRYRDDDERRVAIASRGRPAVLRDTYEGPAAYFAQAEFYFDCTAAWSDDACNGQSFANDNNTMFALKWRARLRRLELPDLGSLLATFALDHGNNSSESYKKAKDLLEKNNGLYTALTKGPLGAAGIGALRLTVGGLIRELESRAYKGAQSGLGTPTGIAGSYH